VPNKKLIHLLAASNCRLISAWNKAMTKVNNQWLVSAQWQAAPAGGDQVIQYQCNNIGTSDVSLLSEKDLAQVARIAKFKFIFTSLTEEEQELNCIWTEWLQGLQYPRDITWKQVFRYFRNRYFGLASWYITKSQGS
jgi:hypothetical protein